MCLCVLGRIKFSDLLFSGLLCNIIIFPYMRIVIPLLRGNFIIKDLEEVKYFYISQGVVFVRDIEDNDFASSKPLFFFRNLLEDFKFFQINRSYLLNLKYMSRIDGMSKQIHLKCGIVLELSRNCMKELKQLFESEDYLLHD